MQTRAENDFDRRWTEIRKQFVSRKVRDKRLLHYWLTAKGEETALRAEKEVRQMMKQDRFKTVMSRQSPVELKILKDMKEEE